MSDSATSVPRNAQLAPWRSALSRALHRNRSKPYSRYFQLATVHPDGRPANRTVVFRGFFPENNGLTFVSDRRSQKADDVAAHPHAEACWYFTETREQFRLAGDLVLVDDQITHPTLKEARQHTWEGLSDKSRRQFYWPHPGHLRTAGADPFNAPDPNPEVPPAVFCLGVLSPTLVDHLELRGDPQNRHRYTREGQDDWHYAELNP